MWSVVMWGELTWFMWSDFVLKWNEVTVKFLGTKVPIRVTLYWGYLIVFWLFNLICILYCVCCNVFCNVWVCVCVGLVMCECFGNMCTCIYCVLYCLYRVSVLFHLCIFILICFVCTGVRTGLDGPGIESRWRWDFPPVQTGPGAHPASCAMGTGSFPGVKYGRGVTLTPHHLLAPRSWKSRAIPLLPLWATTGPVTGLLYLV